MYRRSSACRGRCLFLVVISLHTCMYGEAGETMAVFLTFRNFVVVVLAQFPAAVGRFVEVRGRKRSLLSAYFRLSSASERISLSDLHAAVSVWMFVRPDLAILLLCL